MTSRLSDTIRRRGLDSGYRRWEWGGEGGKGEKGATGYVFRDNEMTKFELFFKRGDMYDCDYLRENKKLKKITTKIHAAAKRHRIKITKVVRVMSIYYVICFR